jgi:hypothetical protein
MWNQNLVTYCAKKIREILPNAILVAGGPNVDSDAEGQIELWETHERIFDFLIPGEGEIPFVELVKYVYDGATKDSLPLIDGAVMFKNEMRVSGRSLKATHPLDDVPSPILNGMLDHFIDHNYGPVIQTSRLCPYKCTFCASGHMTGKIRVFSLDRIRRELAYLAERYNNSTYIPLYVVDENFGINAQDLECASLFIQAKKTYGFPLNLFCYFDKKFNDRTRKICLELSPMNNSIYTIPLQSLNPETMTEINRINLPLRNIEDILSWGKEHKISFSSELIYGLPKESNESFKRAIDYCITYGINVTIHTLILFHGAALSRGSQRDKYSYVVKYRPLLIPSYSNINGDFIAECERVAVSSSSFSYEDYIEIRVIGMLIYIVITAGFGRRVIKFLADQGVSPSTVLSRLVMDAGSADALPAMAKFIMDLRNVAEGELFDAPSDAAKRVQDSQNSEQKMRRSESFYAARMIYEEGGWLFDWMIMRFGDLENRKRKVFFDLIDFSRLEWIDYRSPIQPTVMNVSALSLTYLDLPNKNTNDGNIDIELYVDSVHEEKINALRAIEEKHCYSTNVVTLMPQWPILKFQCRVKRGPSSSGTENLDKPATGLIRV